MKFVAITMLASPQKEIAATLSVARCNCIGMFAGGMLPNTTRARQPSVVGSRPGYHGAGMFWTFVDESQVGNARVTIRGPQGHHLARVLRVHRGERGVAVAGGREYQLEVVEVEGGRVVGRIVGDRPVQGEARTSVALLQAVVAEPGLGAPGESGAGGGIRPFP